MADVASYLSLPYSKVLTKDEDGTIIASIRELPNCSAHGDTEAEALERLSAMQVSWLEEALENNIPIPLPVSAEESLPSGKWVQRVPRSLHRKLSELAQAEGTSLNQLVTAMLAEAVSVRGGVWGQAVSTASHEGWNPSKGHREFAWKDKTQRSLRYSQTFREVTKETTRLVGTAVDEHAHKARR